jgi:hypothetical protein
MAPKQTSIQIYSETEEHKVALLETLWGLGYRGYHTDSKEETIRVLKEYPWTVIHLNDKILGGNYTDYNWYKSLTFEEFLRYTGNIRKDNKYLLLKNSIF